MDTSKFNVTATSGSSSVKPIFDHLSIVFGNVVVIFCIGVRIPFREFCGNSLSQQVHQIEDHSFLKHDKMPPRGLSMAVTFLVTLQ